MICEVCKKEVGDEYSHADKEKLNRIICWNCLGEEKKRRDVEAFI